MLVQRLKDVPQPHGTALSDGEGDLLRANPCSLSRQDGACTQQQGIHSTELSTNDGIGDILGGGKDPYPHVTGGNQGDTADSDLPSVPSDVTLSPRAQMQSGTLPPRGASDNTSSSGACDGSCAVCVWCHDRDTQKSGGVRSKRWHLLRVLLSFVTFFFESHFSPLDTHYLLLAGGMVDPMPSSSVGVTTEKMSDIEREMAEGR